MICVFKIQIIWIYPNDLELVLEEKYYIFPITYQPEVVCTISLRSILHQSLTRIITNGEEKDRKRVEHEKVTRLSGFSRSIRSKL
jgi:hypothetical protein